MKISYDLGLVTIAVAMATYWRHYVFYLSLCFPVLENPWINRQLIYPASFKNIENREGFQIAPRI